MPSDTCDLVVKSVSVADGWQPLKKTPAGTTGVPVLRISVTVKNIGDRDFGPSKTVVMLLTSDAAKLLTSMNTPAIPAGSETTVSARVTPLDKTGCELVFLANGPAAGHPTAGQGEGPTRFREGQVRAEKLNNAFAVPYPPPAGQAEFVYENPAIN